MPYVFVYVKPELYDQIKLLRQFVNNLPGAIAEALSTGPGTEGELKPEEIEVKVFPFGPMDIHHYDIEVIILANDYPERAKSLDDRASNLANNVPRSITMAAMQSLGPHITIKGFVWPFLGKGALKEFSISYHLYSNK
jgi:hypothetical protein